MNLIRMAGGRPWCWETLINVGCISAPPLSQTRNPCFGSVSPLPREDSVRAVTEPQLHAGMETQQQTARPRRLPRAAFRGNPPEKMFWERFPDIKSPPPTSSDMFLLNPWCRIFRTRKTRKKTWTRGSPACSRRVEGKRLSGTWGQ